MTTGMSTLIRAIPAVATSVPPSTTAGPSTTRSTSPAASAPSAIAMAAPMPARRASSGAASPAPAKQSVGNVVSTPAQTPDVPRSARISASMGPTPVMAGRRLRAVSTTATASSAPAATMPGVRTSTAPSSSSSRFSTRMTATIAYVG
jgi:hypothetical protein